MLIKLRQSLYSFLRIQEGGLAQNAFFLVSGNGLAQILTLAASPILTRLFSASDFGEFGIYTAGLGVLILISNARLDYAFLLPKDSDVALRLALAATLTGTLFCTLLLLVLLTSGSSLFAMTHATGLGAYVWPFVLNLLLLSLYNVLNVWAARTNQYRPLATANMFNNGLTGFSQIGFGLMALPSGLVWGQILGRFVALLLLFKSLRSTFAGALEQLHKPLGLWTEARNYRGFAVLNAFPAVMEAVTLYLPTFYFYSFFGATEAGFYLLASRVIGAPLMLLSNASMNALLPRLSLERYEADDVRRVLSLAFKRLSLLAFGLWPLLLIGAFCFPWIFGESWRPATEYALLLSLPLVIKMVVAPLSAYLFCNDNRAFAKWQGFYLIATLAIVGALALTDENALTSMRALVVFDVVMQMVYFLIIARSAQLPWRALMISNFRRG